MKVQKRADGFLLWARRRSRLNFGEMIEVFKSKTLGPCAIWSPCLPRHLHRFKSCAFLKNKTPAYELYFYYIFFYFIFIKLYKTLSFFFLYGCCCSLEPSYSLRKTNPRSIIHDVNQQLGKGLQELC